MWIWKEKKQNTDVDMYIDIKKVIEYRCGYGKKRNRIQMWICI